MLNFFRLATNFTNYKMTMLQREYLTTLPKSSELSTSDYSEQFEKDGNSSCDCENDNKEDFVPLKRMVWASCDDSCIEQFRELKKLFASKFPDS